MMSMMAVILPYLMVAGRAEAWEVPAPFSRSCGKRKGPTTPKARGNRERTRVLRERSPHDGTCNLCRRLPLRPCALRGGRRSQPRHVMQLLDLPQAGRAFGLRSGGKIQAGERHPRAY